jgi:hypothetical protein
VANRISIKLFREDPGSLASYGPKVLSAMDELVGGEDAWDMTQWHGVAKIAGTRVRIERHEDGPEIIALTVAAVPKILGGLAALAVAWCKVKGARRVKLQVGKHKYEGPIEGLVQFKATVRMLEKIADAGK